MTAQILDTAIFQGQEMSVIGFRPEHPFAPQAHGFRPVASTTACYRGWSCVLSIQDRLVLKEFTLNHQVSEVPAMRKLPPPDWNGAKAVSVSGSPVGEWRFEGLDLSLPFTGSLVLGKWDPHSSWGESVPYRILHCSHVTEIAIESGFLVGMEDRTAQIEGWKHPPLQGGQGSSSPARWFDAQTAALAAAFPGFILL